jgi:hypothetical protein
MLISHRKQFIFIKTIKTSGTSVEVYFEPYCMPEGEWEFSHAREQYVSQEGIIGCRGFNKYKKYEWRNHMSATEIKNKIGNEIWNSYVKFTVVRNPFEKIASQFYRQRNLAYSQKDTIKKKLSKQARKLRNKSIPRDHLLDSNIARAFKNWVLSGGGGNLTRFYMIDNQVCIDFFIKQENLISDIEKVCNLLDIPFEPERLPQLKKTQNKPDLKTLYDNELIEFVEKKFQHEIEYFNYDFPD